MPHISDPRYEALAVACLRRYPPPAGHILPVLTREGEGRAVTTCPAPFDILIPDFQAHLVTVEFAPADAAAHLHERTARGLSCAEHKKIAAGLLTLIAVELMVSVWEAYRPQDDRAVTFWVHLGRASPEYTITVMSADRAYAQPEASAHG